MKKTDKLIIDFEYSKSDIHYSDEQMEQMVNLWIKGIFAELQDIRGKFFHNGMALSSINVVNIFRQADFICEKK